MNTDPAWLNQTHCPGAEKTHCVFIWVTFSKNECPIFLLSFNFFKFNHYNFFQTFFKIYIFSSNKWTWLWVACCRVWRDRLTDFRVCIGFVEALSLHRCLMVNWVDVHWNVVTIMFLSEMQSSTYFNVLLIESVLADSAFHSMNAKPKSTL